LHGRNQIEESLDFRDVGGFVDTTRGADRARDSTHESLLLADCPAVQAGKMKR
jgi:hypothetical protein